MQQELIPAAGYVRVSLGRQADGYSPELQREAIKKFAAQQGFCLTVLEEDHQRGSKISRTGYQKVIGAVRQGVVHVVIVYMFDRWGRDGAEWLTRAKEFERLRVPIYSVQEGKDEGGIMRFMRAGMAEEYSRQLAKRVRPAIERAARSGQHCGITPFGYTRLYPQQRDAGRKVGGLLVEDEATSWIVKDLFSRYASGNWGLVTLAQWLNSDPTYPRAPKGGDWRVANVRYILANPAYTGHVRYNASHRGIYATSDPGSEFISVGQHKALVSEEVFRKVQERLGRAPAVNRRGQPTTIAHGILRCSECGGPMATQRRGDGNRKGQYECRNTLDGKKACKGSSYRIDVAHAALWAEVVRLRGKALDRASLEKAHEQLTRVDEGEAKRRKDMQAALDKARKQKDKNMRLLERIDDPTEDEIADFRRRGAEIAATIKDLEIQLGAVPDTIRLADEMRDVCLRLADVHIGDITMALLVRAEELTGAWENPVARDLMTMLVESAHVVDRVPEKRSWWLRMEVAWTEPVRLLLASGLIWLDDPACPRPDYPDTPEERRRQSHLRYAARRKAGIVGKRVESMDSAAR